MTDADPDGVPDGAALWTDADGTHVDVRGLAPPQPIMQILHLVTTLPPGGVVIAHLDRDPLMLYPQLLQIGWWAEAIDGEPGEVRLRLARVGAPGAA